jgi:AmmeMemoRadiSam system protein B
MTADLFIIFGTAHQPAAVPFPLTLKDYETLLGIVATDGAFMCAVERRYATDLLADELAHRAESSIEFQVLFPPYAFGPSRQFCVIPGLVSFCRDSMERQINPTDMAHIADFIQALQEIAAERGEPSGYIIGDDLAHVGMKFGDRAQPIPAFPEQVTCEEHALLAAAARMDAEGFFQVIAEHYDRRHVCSFPPPYMCLSSTPATVGTVLKYGQAVEPAAQSMVPYASVVFH